MTLTKLRGAVLDLDGVITRTARNHAMAWESMFNDYLKKVAARQDKPYVPFDPGSDYLLYVDGKPRMQGVKSFLESRGIDLPYGKIDDSPGAETVCGLGNRKNRDFQKALRREGPEVFASTVDWIKQARARGLKVGVASSSRNCQLIIRLAKIEKLFHARVDGVVSEQLNLTGKP
ncbi:MAG: HAD family hydrolase, partial [bacterium]